MKNAPTRSLTRALTKKNTLLLNKAKTIVPQDSIKKQKTAKGVPSSTSYRVIIPADLTTYQFNRNTYKEQFLQDFIPKKEYDDIIAGASLIMYESWLTKREKDTVHLPMIFIRLIYYSIAMLAFYLITLFISPMIENILICFVSLGSLGIALMLLIFLFFLNVKRPLEPFRTLEEILEQSLENYFIDMNEKYKDVLRFKYVAENYYVECNVLAKFSNEEESFGKDDKRKLENDEHEHPDKKSLLEKKSKTSKDLKASSTLNKHERRGHGDSTSIIEADRSDILLNKKEVEMAEMKK